jgi:hypothetical protein
MDDELFLNNKSSSTMEKVILIFVELFTIISSQIMNSNGKESPFKLEGKQFIKYIFRAQSSN